MRSLWLLIGLAACGGNADDTGDTTDTTPAECQTDNEDCGIDRNCGGEGINMLPGSDCIACHDGSSFEPPEWTLAGTVFSDSSGTDTVSGVIVRVTDAEGTVIEMTSSSAGNFRENDAVVFPITAELEYEGRTIEMQGAQDDGSCNSCHACEGSAGGKLYAP